MLPNNHGDDRVGQRSIGVKLRAVNQGLCDALGQRIAAAQAAAVHRAGENVLYDETTDQALPAGFTKYFAMMDVVCDGDLAGRRLLDVGCGGGGCMAQAFGLGMIPTGIDIYDGQAESLEAARRLLAAYGMPANEADRAIRRADITRPLGELEGRFDFAISIGMLEHIPDPVRRRVAVMNMMRALKPGGTMVLLCAPNRWFPVDLFHYGPHYPFYHWVPEPLKARYLRWVIMRCRPELWPAAKSTAFLSGVRVSEIQSAIVQASPDAAIVQAFPILISLGVNHAWLRRRRAKALVGAVSRALTRVRLEPVILVVAQRAGQ